MEINNLHSYIEQISCLNRELQSHGCLISQEYLFRGHSNEAYELLPSIARGRNTPCDVTIQNGERNLIEMAKNKYPDIFKEIMGPLELLALLQHYGIPTRLLDVTENALVALYFACCDNFDTNGEIFVFINRDNHVENAPIINAIADTYKLTRGAPYRLDHFYQAALNQPYFTEQRHIFEICKDAINGVDWVEKCSSEVLFVHAPTHTLRQQLQQGRYILFPNRIIDNYLEQNKAFDTIIDPISKSDKCIKTVFTVNKNSKKSILEDLQLCGISESTLFCDSVDKVCKGIVDKIKKML